MKKRVGCLNSWNIKIGMLGGIFLLSIGDVNAYFDLGSGSFFIHIILSVLASLLITFKFFKHQVVSFFQRFYRRVVSFFQGHS